MFTYTTRKDGRLMKKITVNGKLKYIYSNDKDDLEKQYIEIKYNNSKGIGIVDNAITVEEWADKWLKLYKNDLEQATIDMYETTIRVHIRPCIGKIKLKNLKQEDIIGMLNKMAEKGITRRREWALLTLKQMLDKAIDNEYIYKNVAKSIKLKKHKSAEKKPLDNDTITRVQNLAKTDFDAFMIEFMLYTGLRRQEVIPLQFKDIDIDNKMISINKAVHFVNNQPKIKKTKNEYNRKVPILDIILGRLKELKENSKENDYIFSNTFGKIMSETSTKRKIKTVLSKLNKAYETEQKNINKDFKLTKDNKINFTYHQLRHTYVCLLHKAGVDVKEAQSFTGHKDITVLLNVYTHLDDEDKINAINKLNNSINIA